VTHQNQQFVNSTEKSVSLPKLSSALHVWPERHFGCLLTISVRSVLDPVYRRSQKSEYFYSLSLKVFTNDRDTISLGRLFHRHDN